MSEENEYSEKQIFESIKWVRDWMWKNATTDQSIHHELVRDMAKMRLDIIDSQKQLKDST